MCHLRLRGFLFVLSLGCFCVANAEVITALPLDMMNKAQQDVSSLSSIDSCQFCDGVSPSFTNWSFYKHLPRNEKCLKDANDPYDPAASMPWNSLLYHGQCQNNNKRGVYVLPKDEALKYGPADPNVITVVNFTYAGKDSKSPFYVARIHLDKIKNVYMQLKTYKQGHSQLRFEFAPDAIELIPQQKGSTEVVKKLSDLILSVEYSAPQGVSYDAIKGLYNHSFATVFRTMSPHEKYNEILRLRRETGLNIDYVQYKIKTNSKEEVANLLKTAFADSEEKSGREVYHTLLNNCATEIVEVVKEGLHNTELAKNADQLQLYVPAKMKEALKKAGLLEEESGPMNPENTPDLKVSP